MSTVTKLTYDDIIARFEPVIGLETHVELGTNTKMFCGCPTGFGAEPNTQICPVCLGLPGSLPVANKAAIEATIRIGLALNCGIASWCRFARKNYFYPDMPKNFQISQYDEPLCVDGWLDVEVDGETVRVGIERVHLEEDTGKTLHVGGSTGRIHGADRLPGGLQPGRHPAGRDRDQAGAGHRRARPDVARAYVTELRDVLRTLGVSDVRMEQGSMRCDVNTSLQPARRAVGHPHRDQERQLAAQRRAGGPVRDHPAGATVLERRRHDHSGDPPLPRGHRRHHLRAAARKRPPTTGTSRSPTWSRSSPTRPGSTELRAALPELPRVHRRRLQEAWGLADKEMQAVLNAGAVDADRGDHRGRRVRRRAPASGGWASWPAAPTSRALTWLTWVPPRPRWPSCRAWSTQGKLNDKLARSGARGCRSPERVRRSR